MLFSTNQDRPRNAVDRPSHWRPSASQISSATRRSFAPLKAEELKTYRKWRRSTLVLYGVLAIFVVALLIAIGPPDPATAKHNPAYSAIASAGQHKSR